MGGKHRTFDRCDNCRKEGWLTSARDECPEQSSDWDWCSECIRKEIKEMKEQDRMREIMSLKRTISRLRKERNKFRELCMLPDKIPESSDDSEESSE